MAKTENKLDYQQTLYLDPPTFINWNAELAQNAQRKVTGTYSDKPDMNKYTERGRGNGLRYGISSMRGWRGEMVDNHSVDVSLDRGIWRNASLLEWSYFGVFDGHSGDTVSSYCSDQLLGAIIYSPEFQEDISQGIKAGFLRLDNRLRRLPDIGRGKDKGSSTALIALISPFNIYIANCGDSKAVLYQNNKSIFQSKEHKPNDPKERERIEKAGGCVTIIESLSGLLTTTRSLGGFRYKNNTKLNQTEQIISPEPDINIITHTKDNEFLILASNGVWDVMNTDEVVNFINYQLSITDDLELICHSLINTCLYKGSRDNITVILIIFNLTKPNDQIIFNDIYINRFLEDKIKEIMFKDKYIEIDKLINILNEYYIPHLSPGIGLYSKYFFIENIYNELKGPYQTESILYLNRDISRDYEEAVMY